MSRRFKSPGRAHFGLMLAVAVLVPGFFAPTAEARLAAPDQAFLDREIPAVQALAARAVPGETGPQEAFELLRQILDRRTHALSELATTLSLTDFDGIETMDRYDRAVLYAVDDVARVGVEADTTLPPQSHAVRFAAVMGAPPDIGDKPVAFMVLELAGILATTADLLENDPAAPAPSPAKLALRYLLGASSTYRQTHEDILLASKAESFRQSSVVLRMRCPRDGSTLTVNTMKNKVGGEGQITTLYFLECPVCHVPDVVEFPMELATRLNQASERQRLKKPPVPARPDRGLNP